MDKQISLFIIYFITFIIAGSIHEFAHAVSANYLGDSTAKNQGRMTINPFAHIDLIGTIIFPVILIMTTGFAFGWMKPVPISIAKLKNPAKDHAVISFAGPFSNFIQACLGILIINAFAIPPNNILSTILYVYVLINVILMVFNLIPIPPLDGGAIARYFIPYSWRNTFDKIANFSFIILLFLVFTNLISLSKITSLYEILINLSSINIIIINMANIALIAYFILGNTNKNKEKLSSINKPKNKPNKNNFYTYLLNKLENNSTLTQKDINEINSIKVSLNNNANICSEEDFSSNDPVCVNCEWLSNCTIRKFDKNN